MTVSSSTSGPNVTMTWSVSSTILVAGLTFSFDHVEWSLGPGSSSFASGAGSTTQTVGYSTSWVGTVTAVYRRTGHSNVSQSSSVSGTTGVEPVTGQTCSLGGFVSGATVHLSFDASCGSGSITNVYVFEDGVNIYSSAGVYGTSFSDTLTRTVGYSASHDYQAEAVFTDGSTAMSLITHRTTGADPGGGGGGGTPPEVTVDSCGVLIAGG